MELLPDDRHGRGSSGVGRASRGCIKCRERHTKCDDVRPSCQQCMRLGVYCEREVVRFRPHYMPRRARASTAARGMSQKTQERPRHASLSCLEFIEETRKFYLRGTKKTEAQDHGSHGDTSAIQDADSGTNIVGKNPSTEETGSPSPSIGGHNQPTLEPRGGLGWGGRTPLSNEEEVSHALRAVDDCSDCVSSEAVGQTVATATSGLHQSRNLWNTGSLLRLDTPVRSLAYLTHRDGSGAHQGLTSWPFDSPDEARLMRYYITDISRGFDLCDPERHFALVVPWRAACCPPLLNAAFALSARCLSRTTSYDAFIANRYYQRCLSNLIPMLGDQDALNNQDLFAAIILLRSLEEIEVPLYGADSRTHLFGSHLFICASKSSTSPPTLPTVAGNTLVEKVAVASWRAESRGDLRHASFLVAFRQEVYTAMTSQRPVDRAFCPVDIDRSLESPASDATWTNWLLLHLADVLDFCFEQDESLTRSEMLQWYDRLSDYADEWHAKKPPSFDPIYHGVNGHYPGSNGNNNPQGQRRFSLQTWLLSDSVATGLLNYHLLRILLLSFDPREPRVGHSRAVFIEEQDKRIKDHVRRLIAIANGNDKCAPHFMLASLGIATAGDRFDDTPDQDELLAFLKTAETLHACSTTEAQCHLTRIWSRGKLE